MKRLVAFLVIVSVVTVEINGLVWGSCSCSCVRPECEYPRTLEECNTCAEILGKSKTSWDDGHCWILIDKVSESDCALRAFRSLIGCSGFAGYTQYPTNGNCWARFKAPVPNDEFRAKIQAQGY